MTHCSKIALTGQDAIDTARYLIQTAHNIKKLTLDQRHDDADRIRCGVRRLVNTMNRHAIDTGWSIDILLGDAVATVLAA